MRQNENYVLVGNSLKNTKWSMKPENEIKVVNGEFYTSIYSFENMGYDVKRNESTMKNMGLVFDRIVFDLDSEENPKIAIDSAFELERYLNRMFPELYTEVWFSGNKGAHTYCFFKEIKVTHPKEIVKQLTNALKTEFNRIDTQVSDVYTRLIRGLGSAHPKTGLHKIQITKDMSMDDILEKAKEKPKKTPIEKYEYSEKWETGILNIDNSIDAKEDIQEFEPVALNDTLKSLFGKYFVKGQMNTVGYPLIHCFKRANVPKQDVKHFFSKFECNHETVSYWIDYAYDNDNIKLVGLNKLRTNLESVGAKESDIEKIMDYFTSTNPIEEMKSKIKQCLGNRVKVEYGQSLLATYLNEMGIDSRYGLNEWYRYTGECGYEYIKPEEIKKLLNDEFSNINISERDIKSAMGFLGNMPTPKYNIVQFNNCMYDINNHKVIESDKKIFSLVKVPYNYNPDAKPKYLKEYFNTSLSKIDLQDILELIGYLFTSGNSRFVLLWFTGIGGSGKTVLANVISGIFKDIVCNVDFSMMGERFALAPFSTAHLNIVGEAESNKKVNKKYYKDLSGNSSITIEKKGLDAYELPSEEVPKSIQVANNIPPFDTDSSTQQRFIVIQFEKSFRNTDEQIVDLDKKIIESKEDMEWLIYQSLEAYKQMCLEERDFNLRKSEEETQQEIINNNNPLLPAIETLLQYEEFEMVDTPQGEDWEEMDATKTKNIIPTKELEEVLKIWIPKNGYNLELNKQGKIYHKNMLDAIKTVFDLWDATIKVNGYDDEYKSYRRSINGKRIAYYPFLIPTKEYDDILEEIESNNKET